MSTDLGEVECLLLARPRQRLSLALQGKLLVEDEHFGRLSSSWMISLPAYATYALFVCGNSKPWC